MMLTRLYRGTGPGTILLLIITASLIWLQPILQPSYVIAEGATGSMPLNTLIIKLLGGSSLATTALSLVLVLLIAFYMAGLNIRLFFITERTMLPGAIFVLLSGLFIPLQSYSPSLPASLILLFAVDRVISSYRKTGVAYTAYDSSLLIGIASLLYFNVIWFFPVVIMGISLLRTFGPRELVLALAGLVTPYAISLGYLYVSGAEIRPFITGLSVGITGHAELLSLTLSGIIVLGIAGLILLLSLLKIGSLYTKKKIKTRKIFSILIWIMLFCVAIYFIIPSSSAELFWFFLIPYSFLVAHMIVFTKRKRFADFIFGLLFIMVLLVQLNRILTLVA